MLSAAQDACDKAEAERQRQQCRLVERDVIRRIASALGPMQREL
jgi:hypothetical protein